MRMIVYCFFMLLTGALGFQQSDYIIDFYRLEITSSNKEYFDTAQAKTNAKTYKYNRTQTVVNATFGILVDLNNDIEIVIQTYKFMSNEYREFPLRFQFNLCNGLKENHFGIANFYNCGNFPRCPIKKGVYSFCKWSPDQSKFPPLIPNGKYQADFELMYHNTKIMLIKAWAEIKRPLV